LKSAIFAFLFKSNIFLVCRSQTKKKYFKEIHLPTLDCFSCVEASDSCVDTVYTLRSCRTGSRDGNTAVEPLLLPMCLMPAVEPPLLPTWLGTAVEPLLMPTWLVAAAVPPLFATCRKPAVEPKLPIWLMAPGAFNSISHFSCR
jgi:hypothetical protein